MFVNDKAWSLNPALNIFLKDENMQPSRHNTPILVTKWMGRLLTLCLLTFIIVMPLKLGVNLNEMNSMSQMVKIFKDLYNYPVILAEKYKSLIFGVGNST